MPLKKILFLVSIFLCLLLWQCKDKIERIEPDTELVVRVFDQNNLTVNGAVVAVFENKSSFEAAIADFSTTNAIGIDTSQSGICKFKNLKGGQKYWIAAYLKDFTTYTSTFKPGLFIYHDNYNTAFELPYSLDKSAITYANLTVKPAESFITYWADNSTPANALPVKLFLGNDSISVITETLSDSPQLYQPGSVTLKKRIGSYPYYTQNNVGCTTIDEINLNGATDIKINTSCTSGIVGFWTSRNNVTSLPISMTLNVNNMIGSITGFAINGAPLDCSSKDLLKYALPPGDYTYFAKSLSDSCVWTGQFNITPNSCNIIELRTCK